MTIIAVMGLGALGVFLRYIADGLQSSVNFPFATFAVNIIGCFLAGWIFSANSLQPQNKIILLAGFCGGLTTFSTLIIQTLMMMKAGDYGRAFSYLLITQIAGFAAAWSGMKTGEL